MFSRVIGAAAWLAACQVSAARRQSEPPWLATAASSLQKSIKTEKDLCGRAKREKAQGKPNVPRDTLLRSDFCLKEQSFSVKYITDRCVDSCFKLDDGVCQSIAARLRYEGQCRDKRYMDSDRSMCDSLAAGCIEFKSEASRSEMPMLLSNDDRHFVKTVRMRESLPFFVANQSMRAMVRWMTPTVRYFDPARGYMVMENLRRPVVWGLTAGDWQLRDGPWDLKPFRWKDSKEGRVPLMKYLARHQLVLKNCVNWRDVTRRLKAALDFFDKGKYVDYSIFVMVFNLRPGTDLAAVDTAGSKNCMFTTTGDGNGLAICIKFIDFWGFYDWRRQWRQPFVLGWWASRMTTLWECLSDVSDNWGWYRSCYWSRREACKALHAEGGTSEWCGDPPARGRAPAARGAAAARSARGRWPEDKRSNGFRAASDQRTLTAFATLAWLVASAGLV